MSKTIPAREGYHWQVFALLAGNEDTVCKAIARANQRYGPANVKVIEHCGAGRPAFTIRVRTENNLPVLN